MAGRRNDIGVRERARNYVGGDKARDVRHVGHEVGVRLITDLAHALIVDKAAVSTRASNDNLGPIEGRKLLQLVVVDGACLFIKTIWESLKVLRDEGDLFRRSLVTVREVAAMREIEAHEAIVGVHQSGVDEEVGGGAGKRCSKLSVRNPGVGPGDGGC